MKQYCPVEVSQDYKQELLYPKALLCTMACIELPICSVHKECLSKISTSIPDISHGLLPVLKQHIENLLRVNTWSTATLSVCLFVAL